jgi:hypothetical protein
MIETNGTELTNVAFIALDQLALAFSIDHDMKQIFVCKLSTTPDRIECNVDKKMFVGNAQQLGFVTNDIDESNNNYTFMFMENACFLQNTTCILSTAIFTENEIVALVTHEQLETFLFDRHQLIALSNDGELRYINAGYRKTDDSNLLYASGSQLRAVAVPLQKIDDTNTFPCDRFTSNGVNGNNSTGNNSIVCTGKPMVTINNDSIIPFAVFDFDINHQLVSQTKLNLSLPKIVVESCQIAAIDKNNKVLAYCCKLASKIICESINSSTKHRNADDFYVGYDFDKQKITLILTVVKQKKKHFYFFVENETTNAQLISFNLYDFVSASVVKYNLIMLVWKYIERSGLVFEMCWFTGNNIQSAILYTHIRFNNWMIPTSSQSPIDLPQYSFGITRVSNYYRVTMIGLHSLPIKYLTVEHVNETLAIMIGKSTIFQRYDNCSQFVHRHSIVTPYPFKIVYRQSIVTLLCCIDANHCGLIQFILNNSSDAVISGYIPDDQNLCANGQGDGTGAECWTNGTEFLNTTTTMQMQTTTTTETKPAMTTKIGTMTTSTTATSPMTAVLTNTITKQFRSTTNVNDNYKSIPTSSEVIDGNHFIVFVRVGAIFLAAIVIVLLICYRCRRMKSPRHTVQSNSDNQMIEMRSIRRMIERRANRISDYEQNTVPVANVETRRHETNVEYDDYM